MKFHAWYPLYSSNISSEEQLKLLELCEEFKPVIDLYMEFEDGLNCIVYPYKSVAKMLQHYTIEGLSAVYYFVKRGISDKEMAQVLF